jgi:hypothetical protein
MTRVLASLVVSSMIACGCGGGSARAPGPAGVPAPPAGAPTALRTPEDLAAAHPDRAERSRALFAEASRVLLHPRCANCHPDGDSPLQGDVPRLHDPPVTRGPADRGVVGVECSSCHQDHNLPLARVPGAPSWHLAPLVMAWVGRSPAQICAQLKDPARNGGRTLADIVSHSAKDELVGWGWKPGADRQPAPGSQAAFGALMQAWVDTGAECPAPDEEKPR